MAFLKKLLKAVGRIFLSAPAPKRKSSPSRRNSQRPAGRIRPLKKKKHPTAAKKRKKRSPSKNKISSHPYPKKRVKTVSERSRRTVKSAASSRPKAAGKLSKPLSPTSEQTPSLGKLVGEVTHYFSKIEVCVVKVKHPIAVGDKIQIKGHTTDFIQTLESMQVESRDVRMARKGQWVGLKVKELTRPGDEVYLRG